jgi:amidophosphoribosyltransferase
MSELIKHECGMALIRLKKPFKYYKEKYGSSLYGLMKLQLLMQKQRNRGQDGAGIVTVKTDFRAGKEYINRQRTNKQDNLKELFDEIFSKFNGLKKKHYNDPDWLKCNIPFMGEVMMGHLRYGTHSSNSMKNVHPVLRRSNWKTRTLALAGNFNLTNVDDLFDELVSYGQHPFRKSDTITVLEKIGHFLDREVQQQFDLLKKQGNFTNIELTDLISEKLDLQKVLKKACRSFDGGYVISGIIGNGDAFVMRDPNGIRPAYYYEDDEVVVAASERPAIQTAFNIYFDKVKELQPGHALIVKNTGKSEISEISDQGEKKSCSFERIYFSRGNDKNIYLERKELGRTMAPMVLESVDYDLENTVFSYIPNTAITAFNGLIEGVGDYLNDHKLAKIISLGPNPDKDELKMILDKKIRIENLVVKDLKLRTFILEDNSRSELVSHVYDVTYGLIKDKKDTVVLIDDSIVRGTTLRDSIISIVARLYPKKIIILSSAPQIRYPDCYGIDMSKMNEFIAFRAMIELIRERKMEDLLLKTYVECKFQNGLPPEKTENAVKPLYSMFTAKQISEKIAQLVTPKDIDCEIEIVFQSIENLEKSIPNHRGDWYFTGNYPTAGGNKVVNRAFMNFIEGIEGRSY